MGSGLKSKKKRDNYSLPQYLANENELGGAENQAQLSFNYVTDKGIKFSGETYKDFERDANQNKIGVNLPITDYANLEASKSKGDFIDDNNLRSTTSSNKWAHCAFLPVESFNDGLSLM